MAKEKQAEAGKTFGVGMPKKDEIASVQMDKSYSEPINTREEIAKTAGVSVGTVAQFEQVQKKKPELVMELIHFEAKSDPCGLPQKRGYRGT